MQKTKSDTTVGKKLSGPHQHLATQDWEPVFEWHFQGTSKKCTFNGTNPAASKGTL